MQSKRLHQLVGVAALAGLGVIMMGFEIPIMPAFPFLKLDPSDLTILLGVLIFGVSGGIEVAVIRSFLHFIITGASVVNLIGDSAALLASIAFMLPLALIVRRGYTARRAAAGLAVGTVMLTLVMSVLNYFVLMPMYAAAFGMTLPVSLMRYVLIGVVPFNLIKGTAISTLFLVLARTLQPWLVRRRTLASR